MSMCDYFEKKPVELFYYPFYIIGCDNSFQIKHIGGKQRNFSIGEMLPLNSLYYQYPSNFIIFDSMNKGDVFVIKDRRLVVGKKRYQLRKSDFGEGTFAFNGTQLNILSISDFDKIKQDHINMKETEYKEKWYVKDNYKNEKQFGELLKCYLNLKLCKDETNSEWNNPMQQFLSCRKTLYEFISSNYGIIERYLHWVNNKPEGIRSWLEDKLMRELIEKI